MKKEYLVTGTYMDKETGKMMSSIAPISGGVSKSGHPYEIPALWRGAERKN